MKQLVYLGIAFLASLNTNSQSLEWVGQITGAGSQGAMNVAVDNNGNVYTCGVHIGFTDLDPSPAAGDFLFVDSQPTTRGAWINKLDAHGNFVWGKGLSGLYYHDIMAYSIDLDAAKNIYVTGCFIDTMDFDPGPGYYQMVSASAMNWDSFVLKLDPNGNFLWAKQFAGSSFDEAAQAAVSPDGYCYITGYFLDTCDFDPGPGTFNLITTQTPIGSSFFGSRQAYVVKLSPTGNLVWVKTVASKTANYGQDIQIDNKQNVYISGTFSDTADFNPGPGIYNLIADFTPDVFCLKLDSAGNFVFAKRFGGINPGWTFESRLAVDAGRNVYVTGYFNATVDFDPGAAVHNVTSNGSSDIFICKLKPNGSFGWVKTVGGVLQDKSSDIDVDANGNIALAGTFQQSVDFDPGPASWNMTALAQSDMFILNLDSAGNFGSAKYFPGTYFEEGEAIRKRGDTLYFVGGMANVTGSPTIETTDFDAGDILYSSTQGDGFIAKYLLETISGISGIDNHSSFTVYPNPSNGNYTVNLGPELQSGYVEIRNAQGQLINHYTFDDTSLLRIKVDAPTGIYFLTVFSNTGTGSVKLLKQ